MVTSDGSGSNGLEGVEGVRIGISVGASLEYNLATWSCLSKPEGFIDAAHLKWVL